LGRADVHAADAEDPMARFEIPAHAHRERSDDSGLFAALK